MIENLKRYTMVIRRDRDGYAIPALKIRRKGDVCKFSELEEALLSATTNSASPKLPPIEKHIEAFERDVSLLKHIAHMPSVLTGARLYHEFMERQLRA